MAKVKFSKRNQTGKFEEFVIGTWFIFDNRLYIKIDECGALDVAYDEIEAFTHTDIIKVIDSSRITIEVDNAEY